MCLKYFNIFRNPLDLKTLLL
uniref:Uncharacterized protein n=1 Tax=Anguilla anguilla TaxID=7936 RepID=A0A0E9P9D7_ANGAN